MACGDERADARPSPEGRYSNYFQVGFNPNEFVIDFGQDHGEGQTMFHSRIILHPRNVPALITILAESVEAWQEKHKAG